MLCHSGVLKSGPFRFFGLAVAVMIRINRVGGFPGLDSDRVHRSSFVFEFVAAC